MDCTQTQEYLLDSLLGEELASEMEEEVRQHLGSCPRCRREAEEFKLAWEDLGRIREARFSRKLDRAVLRRLNPLPRPRLIYLRPALAAGLAIFAVIFLIRFLRSPGGESIREDHSASSLKSGSPRLPDQAKTMKDYLLRSEAVLDKLDRGEYENWRELFDDIFTADLQGKANYLLETLPAGSTRRAVIKNLSDSFWTLLQRGRGREDEAISLPPDMNPAGLRQEIASSLRSSQ